MEAVAWIGFVIGLCLFAVTSHSVIVTLIIPRSQASRLTRRVNTLIRKPFLAAGRRRKDYLARDPFLAWVAPVSLLGLLAVWILLFVVAYGLIMWPLVPGGLPQALRESGSSVFTLGFASEPTVAPTLVMMCAAFTGLIVVALQIAYLPTLYASFNRRETAVTLLQSRAGSPAWGPEILRRHLLVQTLDALGPLYERWEEWAADVLESHTTYPALVFFRSPDPFSSWVLGLLAVMDSAAMYLALSPSRAPVEARLVLRMGYVTFNAVAAGLRLPSVDDPMPDDPIDLSLEEFTAGCGRLFDAGFPAERSVHDAWAHFRGWRVNYETAAYALCDATMAAPGPWSGPRTHMPDQMIIPRAPTDRRPPRT